MHRLAQIINNSGSIISYQIPDTTPVAENKIHTQLLNILTQNDTELKFYSTLHVFLMDAEAQIPNHFLPAVLDVFYRLLLRFDYRHSASTAQKNICATFIEKICEQHQFTVQAWVALEKVTYALE